MVVKKEAVHIVYPSEVQKNRELSSEYTDDFDVAEEWIVLWNVDFVLFAWISGLNGLNVADKVFQAIVWCAHQQMRLAWSSPFSFCLELWL